MVSLKDTLKRQNLGLPDHNKQPIHAVFASREITFRAIESLVVLLEEAARKPSNPKASRQKLQDKRDSHCHFSLGRQ